MSAGRSSAGRGSRALTVLGLTVLALLAGPAVAGPAAAIDDPARPDARVTHGPSCRPGGVVVEVVAGTVPYEVTLATTRTPDGEDSAELAAGGTAVLRTGEVAWGETIDGWLEYRALDGSGDSWVDELAGYTFTRPAEEDCAAITAPSAPATVPGTSTGPGPSAPAPGDDAPAGDGATGDGATGDVPTAPEEASGDTAEGADAGPVRDIEPGNPVPADPAVAVVEEAVDLATAATTPASLGRESSPAPLLVAALALAGAAAGLGRTLGVPGLRRRRPTPGA